MNLIRLSIQYLCTQVWLYRIPLFFGYMYPNLQTYIFLCFFCVKFLTLAVYNLVTIW